MFCQNCGCKIEEGDQFCSKCGCKVEAIEKNDVNLITRPQNQKKVIIFAGIILAVITVALFIILNKDKMFNIKSEYQLIKMETWHYLSDGETMYTNTIYDENGNIIETLFDSDYTNTEDEDYSKNTYKYRYDKYNNPIKCTFSYEVPLYEQDNYTYTYEYNNTYDKNNNLISSSYYDSYNDTEYKKECTYSMDGVLQEEVIFRQYGNDSYMQEIFKYGAEEKLTSYIYEDENFSYEHGFDQYGIVIWYKTSDEYSEYDIDYKYDENDKIVRVTVEDETYVTEYYFDENGNINLILKYQDEELFIKTEKQYDKIK